MRVPSLVLPVLLVAAATLQGCGAPTCAVDVTGQWTDDGTGTTFRMTGTESAFSVLWTRDGTLLPGEQDVLDRVRASADRSSLVRDVDMEGKHGPTNAPAYEEEEVRDEHVDVRSQGAGCHWLPFELGCRLHYRLVLDGVPGASVLSGHVEAWRVARFLASERRDMLASWDVRLRRNTPMDVSCGGLLGGGPIFGGTDAGTQRPDASRPDAARPDAAKPDAAQPDAAIPDASFPDASEPDAAPPDASHADAGA